MSILKKRKVCVKVLVACNLEEPEWNLRNQPKNSLKKKQKRSIASLILIREKLAHDLCNEIYMSKDEAYEIIDFSFQLSDKLPETYDQLKSEIKSYIIINMLSLVTKFH